MTVKVELSEPLRKKKKIPIGHAKTRRQQQLFFSISGVLFLISLWQVGIDRAQFFQGLERLPHTLQAMTKISFASLPLFLSEMLASLVTAFLAIVIGVVGAIALSFLIARNVAPSKGLSHILHVAVILIRSVPTIVWVLMAVASIGFGYMAGILGLILPTTAYLTRAFAAQIEELGNAQIEAIRSVGGSWFHVVGKGLLPTLLPIFLATIALKFELNVADSVVLGMIGAGGIGVLIQDALVFYNFSDMTLGILVVFITMFCVENVTRYLRKKLV